MSKGHAVLRFLRKVHLYLGIFTTPALLFFAFTGALQTFNLHESTTGSSYKPPAWIATLAQLHKKQDSTVPVRRPRPGNQEPGASRNGEPPSGPRKSHLPMKIFFLLVSVSLILSTLTGVYMSYRYDRSWRVLTGLLVAGLVAPLFLLPF
jgi:hypothetical protein